MVIPVQEPEHLGSTQVNGSYVLTGRKINFNGTGDRRGETGPVLALNRNPCDRVTVKHLKSRTNKSIPIAGQINKHPSCCYDFQRPKVSIFELGKEQLADSNR